MASWVTPAWASARPAAPSRSCATATSRCSVETYSSFIDSACFCARSSAARSRSPMYWPLPPRTCGIFSIAASSCEVSVSARTPSLPRIGATTPSFWAISAWSRCSGSTAWCPRSPASDCAACSASCALTVSLSSLIVLSYLPSGHLRRAPVPDGRRIVARRESLRAVLSLRLPAWRIGPERPQALVQLFLGRRQLGRHHDPHGDQFVAGAAALEPRHPVAGQPERAPARRRGRNLHRHLAPQRRHLDRRAQRRLGRRDRQREVHVVALALELRVRGDGDDQVEVAAASRAAAALTGHAHFLPRAHAGGNPHVDLAARALPARAVAGRARLAADVATALARGARLVELERERLARSAERLLQRELDARLHVLAASSARTTADAAAEQVLEAAPAPGAAPAQIAEDRPEELREVAALAVFDLKSTGARGRALLSVALPVGTERVVASAFLGIGQDFVRLGDLLEASVLAFVDVGMVLAGELAVRGLDGLVVRTPVDAQNPIVVLEFDRQPQIL